MEDVYLPYSDGTVCTWSVRLPQRSEQGRYGKEHTGERMAVVKLFLKTQMPVWIQVGKPQYRSSLRCTDRLISTHFSKPMATMQYLLGGKGYLGFYFVLY